MWGWGRRPPHRMPSQPGARARPCKEALELVLWSCQMCGRASHDLSHTIRGHVPRYGSYLRGPHSGGRGAPQSQCAGQPAQEEMGPAATLQAYTELIRSRWNRVTRWDGVKQTHHTVISHRSQHLCQQGTQGRGGRGISMSQEQEDTTVTWSVIHRSLPPPHQRLCKPFPPDTH